MKALGYIDMRYKNTERYKDAEKEVNNLSLKKSVCDRPTYYIYFTPHQL